jgi:hypothetical protein
MGEEAPDRLVQLAVLHAEFDAFAELINTAEGGKVF